MQLHSPGFDLDRYNRSLVKIGRVLSAGSFVLQRAGSRGVVLHCTVTVALPTAQVSGEVFLSRQRFTR